MSYNLIYDKQFIKVKKENKTLFVPMILSGCNNLYETKFNGKEQRVRSWFPFTLNVGLLGTVEEFVSYWTNQRAEIIERAEERKGTDFYTEYNDKEFGYWASLSVSGRSTRGTTYGSVVGIFTTGAKQSLTIEELYQENVKVVVTSGYITSEQFKLGFNPYMRIVSNDTELFEAIAECRKKFEGSDISTTIEFHGMREDKPKRLRNKYFKIEPKEKTKKVITESYRIKVDNVGYFKKETSRNMLYNMTGKVFLSKSQAVKKLSELQAKSYKCTFELEISNNQFEVMV